MRVLVLGATGSVGKLIVSYAIARGHDVTALVRRASAAAALAPELRVVAGDALDADAVARACAGQEAVIYALGVRRLGRTTFFSRTTRILLDAMEAQAVRRLVAITGVGAGDTKGHGGFLHDVVFYPLVTRRIYEDKDRQEALIRESAIEWVLVRPAVFRKRTPREPLRVASDVRGVTLRWIARPEVASFVVDQLDSDSYLRDAVFIGHA
jgi:putative NADH-flavin reductase